MYECVWQQAFPFYAAHTNAFALYCWHCYHFAGRCMPRNQRQHVNWIVDTQTNATVLILSGCCMLGRWSANCPMLLALQQAHTHTHTHRCRHMAQAFVASRQTFVISLANCARRTCPYAYCHTRWHAGVLQLVAFSSDFRLACTIAHSNAISFVLCVHWNAHN